MTSVQLSQRTGGAVDQGGDACGVAQVQRSDAADTQVNVPNNCFAMTNHMLGKLEDSLPPGTTLSHFFVFPGCLYVMVTCFVLSLGSILFWFLNIFGFAVMLLLVVLTCQYIHVCHKSLPLLNLVPVVDHLSSLYSHKKVDINRVEGVFLIARQAGLGQEDAASGKITFLVINPEVARKITLSKILSIVFFFICFIILFLVFFCLICNLFLVFVFSGSSCSRTSFVFCF